MREIKYKVIYKTDERLDNQNPGWIISEPFILQNLQPGGDTTQFNFSDGSYLGIDDVDWKEELVWIQYTGLHDKNGKEIYEGDIVQVEGAMPAEVYWEYSSWQLRNGELTGGMLGNFESDQIEIIGNIYENPELLEEEL